MSDARATPEQLAASESSRIRVRLGELVEVRATGIPAILIGVSAIIVSSSVLTLAIGVTSVAGGLVGLVPATLRELRARRALARPPEPRVRLPR